MRKLAIVDMAGASVGELEVADGLLGGKRGGQAVHDVVVARLAGRRAGTASTLSKGEVAGSNKKPWRQKGTGRARAGLRQSPVWRGGGVAFGPKPRDFSKKVNRKTERLAFRRALSDKIVAGQVRILDPMTLAQAKTKAVVSLLKALALKAPVLFVLDKPDRSWVLAARNVPGVEVAVARDVGVYQLMRYPAIVASRLAIGVLTSRLAAGQPCEVKSGGESGSTEGAR